MAIPKGLLQNLQRPTAIGNASVVAGATRHDGDRRRVDLSRRVEVSFSVGTYVSLRG